jgi:hypothetical protein
LPSLGWHGPHEATLQPYSGPASPYWASKAFVGLLARSDHPLWTSKEEEAPVEGPDRVLALPAPGLLVQTTRADGIVRLHNHGSDHVRPHEGESAVEADPHYGRFAYSTRTGPTSAVNPSDNHLSLVVGGARSVRRRIHPLGAGGGGDWGWAASWHRPIFVSGPPTVPGLRVESVTVARSPYELRIHRVIGAPHRARVEQTGWATGPDEDVVSTLHPLHGWTTKDEVRAPQGTAFTPWAHMPRLSAETQGTSIYAALATLTTHPVDMPDIEVTVVGNTIEFLWPDNVLTRITFDPLTVSG